MLQNSIFSSKKIFVTAWQREYYLVLQNSGSFLLSLSLSIILRPITIILFFPEKCRFFPEISGSFFELYESAGREVRPRSGPCNLSFLIRN